MAPNSRRAAPPNPPRASKRTGRDLIAVGVLALILAAAAAAFLATRSTSTPATTPASAPPARFAVLDQRGTAITSADMRGHTTVLAFVQICSSGATTLHTLAAATPPGVRALAVDYGASAADLARFARGIGIRTRPNLAFASDPNGSAAHALGLTSLDTIIVLNTHGHVTWSATSPSPRDVARHVPDASPA